MFSAAVLSKLDIVSISLAFFEIEISISFLLLSEIEAFNALNSKVD